MMRVYMLTSEEALTLRRLLDRAATKPAEPVATIAAGDLVQLKPGVCPTWETSFLLVGEVRGAILRGAILQPHRSGCREAWWKFAAADVARIGSAAYPEPAADIRAWCYTPPCPLVASASRYRRKHAAMHAGLAAEAAAALTADIAARRRQQAQHRKENPWRTTPASSSPPSRKPASNTAPNSHRS